MPAAVLTAVLRGAADGSLDGASLLLSGLPGRRATTARSPTAATTTRPPRPGTVRAKTGTLVDVHALAGTVGHRGRPAAGLRRGRRPPAGSEAAAEDALDDFAAALAVCGCR